ncbi:hypothetical protein ES708_23236 [subsurface metagenome]
MSKLKNPLFSFKAQGALGDALTFLRRRKQDIVEKTPKPEDAKSLAQLSWRHMYQKAVALWHALSAEEKQEWESLARRKHMTGFAWFVSQALKPNPGLYLPLQGGSMTGDIVMGKNRILKLPLPLDTQEPLTLAYFNANIAPYLYNEGARVYHSIAQAIPHNEWTVLTFGSELYDTDSIHDLVVNPDRLTCKTAGKYLISFAGSFEAHAAGRRHAAINATPGGDIARKSKNPTAGTETSFTLTTVWNMAVGDYVKVAVFQTSGGNLDMESVENYTPHFMMQRIGG